MADGEVKIDTRLDTDGLDKGLKDLKVKLNNLGVETNKDTKATKDLNEELGKTGKKADEAAKAIDKTAKKQKNLGDYINAAKTKITGTTIAGVAATVAVKKTIDALNDCEAAYKTQIKAEQALQTAAQNNPYLNNESVYALRNFASELQSVSEIGDEVSLQVMSQLAATGRTESEIMQIMTAAADMAAVTGQDIGTVAQQLNATFNGNAGTLGRQISAINNLTKEELENGKAIELVAKQYKGAAKDTADVNVQLSNAWGDFKENIGRGWSNVTKPVKTFFLDVLNDINEATTKTKNLKDANDARDNGTSNAQQTKTLLDNALEELKRATELKDETRKLLNNQAELNATIAASRNTMSKKAYQDLYKNQLEQVELLTSKVQQLTIEYGMLNAEENAAAETARKEAEAAAAVAEAQLRDEQAIEHITANKQALADEIKLLELKKNVTGKDIDAQELYNVYLQSYIDLITKSNGLVSENNSAAKERLKLVQDQLKLAKEAEETQKDENERKRDAERIAERARELIRDEAQERLDLLEKIKAIDDEEVLSAQDKADAIAKINDEIARERKEALDEEERKQKEHFLSIAAEHNQYAQKTISIIKDASNLMLENVQTEYEAELAALENRYNKGEVTEEEYYEKTKELKKKAAQDEYKIKMFEWTASMLSATANIAEGIAKAYAQGYPAGLITGALVGAAGAVQLAAITAAKPIPPHFREGGVIGGFGGASYGSDNTIIAARTGEFVLNANQQRALWDKLNGQDGRGGWNLTVNNTQSGRVDTNVYEKDGALYIDIIDKHINKGFADGTFDAGFSAMNTRNEGVRIL